MRLDLLHLYDKFLGDLPEDFEDFGKAPVRVDLEDVAGESDGRLDLTSEDGRQKPSTGSSWAPPGSPRLPQTSAVPPCTQSPARC